MRHANAYPSSGRVRGFTLFEVVIVILLVAAFLAVLFDRSRNIQEMAEKTAMDQTVNALRQALLLKSMALIATGKVDSLPTLANANPMSLLEKRIENDAGEFYNPEAEDIPGGSWYFDLKTKELVYLVKLADHLQPKRPGRPMIHFKIQSGGKPGDGLKSGPSGESRLVLVEVAPYQWAIQ